MLSLANISVQFGAKKLFENVSFIVGPRDRIGLVGSNGTGKSTLLKIINGMLEPDSGEVALSKHTTVGYLPQEGITTRNPDISLYDEVYNGLDNIARIKQEVDDINSEMETIADKDSDEYFDMVEELGSLQHRFEEMDGFRVKSSIEKILSGLGFSTSDLAKPTIEFSGGWQMRIALAKLLLKHPSVLLLDEPTNHLDLDSLLWLEGFLRSYEGAVILVSHDRQFLDNITGKTVELYAKEVTIYKGNYSFYVKEKETNRELLEKRYANQQRYLKQQERFIERFRYKASKASAVQSRIKMLEKLDVIELEDEEAAMHFHFPPATHSGIKIIELKNISKSYGDNHVLDKLDLLIERGDKIGFVGMNGAGKSTLARIIVGSEKLDRGERILGHEVQIEYYSQQQADTLEPNHNVLETLDEVATGDIRKQLRTILGSFLFKGDDVFKSVSVLSGGEKSRLALARMLLKPSNFLILDEPTNHLDMNSKEVLMDALRRYEGSILVISHDRIFLDGIVNKVIEVKNKNIKSYAGNCSYYIMKKTEEEQAILDERNNNPQSETGGKSKRNKEQKREEAELRNKLFRSTKTVKEKILSIESKIIELEDRKQAIEMDMATETFYKNQDNVKSANKELVSIKSELKKMYSEWETENRKLMEIERSVKG
ncbi:MAG: ABC-F family ATP-binding cassette domain-containing protein [Ignavibacteria bacterium]